MEESVELGDPIYPESGYGTKVCRRWYKWVSDSSLSMGSPRFQQWVTKTLQRAGRVWHIRVVGSIWPFLSQPAWILPWDEYRSGIHTVQGHDHFRLVK